MTETPLDYDVVLLVERALSPADAARVRSLHEAIEEPVVYHVLLPREDAAERVQASMGSLTSGEVLSNPPIVMDPADLQALRDADEQQSNADLDATLAALHGAGATATGTVVDDQPIDALAAKVAEIDGREAIILTEPHVVAEFFHLDWTSQARRRIGVPVLHLLEHENFDEQADGYGEGITGL